MKLTNVTKNLKKEEKIKLYAFIKEKAPHPQEIREDSNTLKLTTNGERIFDNIEVLRVVEKDDENSTHFEFFFIGVVKGMIEEDLDLDLDLGLIVQKTDLGSANQVELVEQISARGDLTRLPDLDLT